MDFETLCENFLVPKLIATDYINECNEIQLKVLLIALLNLKEIDCIEIATKLGKTPAEVSDCIDFWIRKKILKIRNSMSKTEEVNRENNKLITKLNNKEIVELVKNSKELNFLTEQIPIILNRHTNTFDMTCLVNLHFNFGMSVELIMLLLQHCALIGKSSAAAVEQEGTWWFENGISTYDDAEKYIETDNMLEKLQAEIKKMLKLSSLNKRQKLIIKRWYMDYKYGISIIEQAYKTAIEQDAETSLAYINGILTNWFKNGFRNLEDITNNNKTTKICSVRKFKMASNVTELSSFTIEDIENL